MQISPIKSLFGRRTSLSGTATSLLSSVASLGFPAAATAEDGGGGAAASSLEVALRHALNTKTRK
jgi:hypothetical protein